MLRTVYTPNSNRVSFPIPDEYIGAELEILVYPTREVLTSNTKKKMQDADTSFGAWADMDKTTEEICSEIRASRTFRNRNLIFKQITDNLRKINDTEPLPAEFDEILSQRIHFKDINQ